VWRQNLLLPFLAYYGFFSFLSAIYLRKYFRPTKEISSEKGD
jgi:hypothetical protein